MATCIEYHEERTQECDDWEDQGYNSCADWNPWFAWLCIAWTWVTHWVCVGWVWITTSVCVAWDIVVTLIDGLIIILEGIGLGYILNGVGAFIELIFSIPYVGRFLRWIWSLAMTLVSAMLSALDIFGYFLGIRPQKKLRVCGIILIDEAGNRVAQVADVLVEINRAIDLYFRETNIRIMKSAPWQFSTGFMRPAEADESWLETYSPMNPAGMLDTSCAAGHLEDLGVVGSERQLVSLSRCAWGNWRRVLGFGAPVVIFVVRTIGAVAPATPTAGTFIAGTAGCGLGPFADYVTLAATLASVVDSDGDGITDSFGPLLPGNPVLNGPNSPIVLLGHELGHVCNLAHTTDQNDTDNFMFSNDDNLTDANGNPLVPTDDEVYGWQMQLIRMSRHVSYF
jgi:hypothetical protein